MSDTAHTPGPWTAHLCMQNGRRQASVTGADGSPVASCGGAAPGFGIYAYESRERQNSNARLIAAAPELLKVLNLFLRAHYNGTIDNIVIEKVEAEIAKATGGK